jgi:hypothetical protein
LEIPADKQVFLYAGLSGASSYTLDIKGKVVVGYNGLLVATAGNPVTVTDDGGIEVLPYGVLVTDVAASIHDGSGTTVLGTSRVVINGQRAVLNYSTAFADLDAAKTAMSYITKGVLAGTGLKLSELTDIPNVGPERLVYVTAGTTETATELVIPVGAILTTNETLAAVTRLEVRGLLNLGGSTTLAGLKTLIIAEDASLEIDSAATSATLAGVTELTLDGSLDAPAATLVNIEELMVKGVLNLPAATFAKLKSLTVLSTGSFTTGTTALFPELVNLTVNTGGVFDASAVTTGAAAFGKLTNAGSTNTLTVDGTIKTGTATAQFGALTGLVVNGVFEVGAGTTSFAKLTDLTVKTGGKFGTAATGASLGALLNLRLENGAEFTAGGGTTLAKVTTLSVGTGAALTANSATFAGVTNLRVDGTVNLPAATFAGVTDLTVNGTLNAPAATFAKIVTPQGTGSLTAGPVPATGNPSKAAILLNSELPFVSLANTSAIAGAITVESGKTRVAAGTGNFTGAITVNGTLIVSGSGVTTGPVTVAGGNLSFTSDNAAPTGAINVTSGNLSFTGSNAAPAGVITVANGQALFSKTSAPAGNIVVNGGGKLSFTGGSAVPTENITAAPGGEIALSGGAQVTIAATKTLDVQGTLTAVDLEIKGVKYEVPTGGTLVVKDDNSNGSTIAATVVTGDLTGTFTIAPGGYINDSAFRRAWALRGGSDGGAFAYTGGNNGTLTLGTGKIATNQVAKIASPSTGYVALTNTVTIEVSPLADSGIGLTLASVVIDLTDGGFINIRPNARLNLTQAASQTVLTNAGCITTNKLQTGSITLGEQRGIAASQPLNGALAAKPGTTALTGNTGTLNVAGAINGGALGIRIDSGDIFQNTDGVISVLPN